MLEYFEINFITKLIIINSYFDFIFVIIILNLFVECINSKKFMANFNCLNLIIEQNLNFIFTKIIIIILIYIKFNLKLIIN